jgi:hypothetical protein
MKVTVSCDKYGSITCFSKLLKAWGRPSCNGEDAEYRPPGVGDIEVEVVVDGLPLTFYPHEYEDLLKVQEIKKKLERR